ncbi:MAG TPA: DUF11 domain-containing protein [Thermoanaerobaculia bacterium]|jgi:uncharacterized repeat protein (TIGR01451 family)
MKTKVLPILLFALSAAAQTPQQTIVNPPVDFVPKSDLRVLKSYRQTNPGAGQFTLTVTNYGPLTNSGPIVITDALPSGLAYVSGSSGCTASGQNVTCTRTAPLSAGQSYSVTIDVNVTGTTSMLNCVSVRGAPHDPDDANNRSCACVEPVLRCRELLIDISTGSNNGTTLAAGSPDPDWMVTSVPSPAVGANQPAMTVAPSGWMAPPAGTAWITARPASGTSSQTISGDYTYELAFQLPPDLANGRCAIDGSFAVDNTATLTLDGTSTVASFTTYGSAAFSVLHAIPTFTFGATPGPHTLRAVVRNGNGTTSGKPDSQTGFLLKGTIRCGCPKGGPDFTK